MLEFKIQGQKITRLDRKELATDSCNYLKAHFTFCEDWSNSEKAAIFRSSEVERKEYLDENNECFVPWEVLSKCECGINCFKDTLTIYASVYAVDEVNNKRITTNEIKVEINKSGYSETAGSSEVPASVSSHKTTEVNANSTDEQFATAKAVFDYGETKANLADFNKLKEDTEVTKTATGNAITIESAKAPLASLKLYGKTTQDGTPTPTEPKELKSVGDSGSFSLDMYGKNWFPQANVSGVGNVSIACSIPKGTYTLSAEHTSSDTDTDFSLLVFGYTDGSVSYGTFHRTNRYACIVNLLKDLKSISFFASDGYVKSEGDTFSYSNIQLELGTQATPYEPYKTKQSLTFTDTLRGMGDIADEKDFARGVTTKRFEKRTFNGSEAWVLNTSGTNTQRFTLALSEAKSNGNGVCTHFNWITSGFSSDTEFIGAYEGNLFLRVSKTIASTVAELQTWLASNNITTVYELAEPIETPLSETELNAYRHLMTNRGNSTILSEATAEITYYVNKPAAQAIGNIHTQVNNDYFKLSQAIITTGGN